MVELGPLQPTGPVLDAGLRGLLNHAGAGLGQANQIVQSIVMERQRHRIDSGRAAWSGGYIRLSFCRATECQQHASKQRDTADYGGYC